VNIAALLADSDPGFARFASRRWFIKVCVRISLESFSKVLTGYR
jgi:hypothetical protein